MKPELEEVLSLVDQQIGLYERLAELLDQEQEGLIKLDLDRLQAVSKAKETTALKIKVLVPSVAEAIRGAARVLGRPSEPLCTLAELAESAPEPASGRLSRAGTALARLKGQIARHNQDNHNFVQETLQIVSDSVAILTGAALTPRKGYQRHGLCAPASNVGPRRLSREV